MPLRGPALLQYKLLFLPLFLSAVRHQICHKDHLHRRQATPPAQLPASITLPALRSVVADLLPHLNDALPPIQAFVPGSRNSAKAEVLHPKLDKAQQPAGSHPQLPPPTSQSTLPLPESIGRSSSLYFPAARRSTSLVRK